MNVVKFKESCSIEKNHIIFCIVDKTDSYKNNKEIIKNISDWTVQNITILGYTVLVSADEDLLLTTASNTNADHAVMLATGTEFINSYDWFDDVENLCKEDFFIAGHILDRGEFYYELHDQCYVVNLKTFKQLGSPTVGKVSFFETHQQTMPTRSDENIHDQYTPVWISSGTESKEYAHKAHGWNLISIALKNNLTVKVFNDGLRSNKLHYYPEYSSYHDQVSFLYSRMGFCNSVAIYLNNSETVIPVQLSGAVEQLVVPASGLNWVRYLEQQEFNTNTKIKFYDYSFLTLEYVKYVVDHWDGDNYQQFALDYFNNKFNFIGEHIPYCGSDQFVDIDKDLWTKIKSTVTFEYHWFDLLNTQADVTWIENKSNTIINLTNAFNYIGTATVRSVKDRIFCENMLIEKLQNCAPDSVVIFTRRAAAGFVDTISNTQCLAKDLTLTNIESLTKPTWHAHDWSN